MSVALLIVGHGSRSTNADDVLPYYVDLFKDEFEEVMACYLEREPRIEDALGRIEAERVFVMPLLVAHGYHTRVTIPGSLGIEGNHGFSGGKEIFLLEPLGRSEHVAKLIKERIGEAKK